MVELFISPDAETAQNEQQKDGAPKQRRRWVRLELFSPVTIHELEIDANSRTVRRKDEEKSAMILNISGGGVLLSTFDGLTADDLILMKFQIKEFDTLSDVLGRIKRVETAGDSERLIGVEFLTPEKVDEEWLADQLAQLVDDPMGFSDRLHRLVSRFVFRQQISDGSSEKDTNA
jgi:hypothetical protein